MNWKWNDRPLQISMPIKNQLEMKWQSSKIPKSIGNEMTDFLKSQNKLEMKQQSSKIPKSIGNEMTDLFKYQCQSKINWTWHDRAVKSPHQLEMKWQSS